MPSPKRKKALARPFPLRFGLGTGLPGIPLTPSQEILISTELEHAVFLQCSEVYRVAELLLRRMEEMVETYSKFRTRDPFKDALQLRFFESDLALLSQADPHVQALVLGAFNQIHELKLRLSHIDALPFTVKELISHEAYQLARSWEEIRVLLKEKQGWELAELPSYG